MLYWLTPFPPDTMLKGFVEGLLGYKTKRTPRSSDRHQHCIGGKGGSQDELSLEVKVFDFFVYLLSIALLCKALLVLIGIDVVE